MPRRKGVFCIEGEWHPDLTKRWSVRPTLQLLEQLESLRYIHQSAVTRDQLKYYVEQWSLRKYSSYEVGFFALHGSPSQLWLSNSQSTSLHEVATWISPGCWQGRQIYIGACSVLQGSDRDLSEFLKQTGASMVCGFTKQIDWIESAAFETVVLDRLVNAGKVNSLQQLVSSARWAPLAQHLGFRVVYATGESFKIPSMRSKGSSVTL
ncbi:DUF6642 family protein [Micromonospora sp. NPDC048871]|uniref:DUF6642 family protein n=1 Tax=unclassified Micromonospora TaxID=2617518 RepID=UPI002E136646|nr:hypothetical protein OIE53_04795 [Micromonospora sp. NBC_01739]